MESTYWQDVMAADYAVPGDRGLTDLTEELVRGLADPASQDDHRVPLPHPAGR